MLYELCSCVVDLSSIEADTLMGKERGDSVCVTVIQSFLPETTNAAIPVCSALTLLWWSVGSWEGHLLRSSMLTLKSCSPVQLHKACLGNWPL